MVTPLVTTTFAPSQQFSPIRVGPFVWKPCHGTGCLGVVVAVARVGHEAAVRQHAVLADLHQLLRGDHHPEVQERPLPDPHARAPRGGDPHVRLEQRSLAELQPPLAQCLQHVPVHRPAHERLTAHRLPVDPRAIPRQRAALIPAPLHRPQPGLAREIAVAQAATFARGLRLAAVLLARDFFALTRLRRDYQLGEKLPRMRDRLGRHLLRRSLRDHPAALLAALRTHVDQPVSALDHIEVVLDHDHAVPRVDKPLQHLQQPLHVGEVQARRRLVEDVERPARRDLRELGRELHTLRLAP